ncbi:MAG: transposase [Pseudomonadota bacterium]|nr:transposase [Pseudomonadota bacterium]
MRHAMSVEVPLVGADVAKATLAIASSATEGVITVGNEAKAIRGWLQTLSGPVCIAVEATNIYHLTLVDLAYAAGHTVYVVDGYRLKTYRESIGGRAKTDVSDARLLLRYLKNEREDLRIWSPPPKGYATLQRLLRRRAVLIQAKTTLRQSLACLPELKASTGALMHHMARLDGLLKKRIVKTLVDLDWQAQAIGFGGQFAVDGILIGQQVDERQPSIHDRQNPVARLFNLTASFFTPASCPALFGPASLSRCFCSAVGHVSLAIQSKGDSIAASVRELRLPIGRINPHNHSSSYDS